MNINSHDLFAVYEVLLIAYPVAVSMILIRSKAWEIRPGFTTVTTAPQGDDKRTSSSPRLSATVLETPGHGSQQQATGHPDSNHHHDPGRHHNSRLDVAAGHDTTSDESGEPNTTGATVGSSQPVGRHTVDNRYISHRVESPSGRTRRPADWNTTGQPVTYLSSAYRSTTHHKHNTHQPLSGHASGESMGARPAQAITEQPARQLSTHHDTTGNRPTEQRSTHHENAHQRQANQTLTNQWPTSQTSTERRSTYHERTDTYQNSGHQQSTYNGPVGAEPAYRQPAHHESTNQNTSLSRPYAHRRVSRPRRSVYERQEIPIQHRLGEATTPEKRGYPTHGQVLTAIRWRDYRVELRQASLTSATILAINSDGETTVLGAIQWDARACDRPVWTETAAQQRLLPRDRRESFKLGDRLAHAIEELFHKRTPTPTRWNRYSERDGFLTPQTRVQTPTQIRAHTHGRRSLQPWEQHHGHDQAHAQTQAAEQQVRAVSAYAGSLSPHRDVQPRHHPPRDLPVPRTPRRVDLKRIPLPYHQLRWRRGSSGRRYDVRIGCWWFSEPVGHTAGRPSDGGIPASGRVGQLRQPTPADHRALR
ncbi:hypothetical protein [Haloglycomyces albus]|uniref:hypothetical protein n=1 Tax=Haloglycomyces albus TaxID=526067 RepID=UPI00046D7FFF|nr:hypothetical protein [Haloglycomyces albus]